MQKLFALFCLNDSKHLFFIFVALRISWVQPGLAPVLSIQMQSRHCELPGPWLHSRFLGCRHDQRNETIAHFMGISTVDICLTSFTPFCRIVRAACWIHPGRAVAFTSTWSTWLVAPWPVFCSSSVHLRRVTESLDLIAGVSEDGHKIPCVCSQLF